MARGELNVTIDELIATLKRTSLPTVVIEGSDDVIVFRRLEEHFQHLGISVLPAGGRDMVLQLHSRRQELPDQRMVGFVADRDLWAITGIPIEQTSDRITFTSGYSIENDVYIDGDLERLMHGGEVGKLSNERELFLQWYALAVSRVLKGEPEPLKSHPAELLDSPEEMTRRTKLNDGEEYPAELLLRLQEEYKSLVRGKSLLALLMRQLSYAGRIPKHRHDALLEQVSVNRGPLLSSIYEAIGSMFKHLQQEPAAT